MDSSQNKRELRDRLGNIDQIRDILVGTQLRDFNTRIEEVEKSLSSLKQEMRDRTEEIKQVLSTELKAIVENIEKKNNSSRVKNEQENFELQQQIEVLNNTIANYNEIPKLLYNEINSLQDNVEKRIKTLEMRDGDEKIELRRQIDVMSKRVKTNIERIDNDIDKQITSLRDDLLSSREKLQEYQLSLRTQIFEEIDRRISKLTTAKVAKDDLAEILFEVGLRLKGNEFVPTLNKAGESDVMTGYLMSDSSS